jgi:hypothetical protein
MKVLIFKGILKETYKENWLDGHGFEDIMHLDARLKRCVWDLWTDGPEETIFMVVWYLGKVQELRND